jgi:hypothetical protein
MSKYDKRENRVDFLKKLFPEMFEIVHLVCNFCYVDYDDMMSKRRFRELVDTRQMICYIINKYYHERVTLADIGLIINCDHSSVIHSIKCVNNLIQTNKPYKKKLYEILFLIENDFSEHLKTISRNKSKTEMTEILISIQKRNAEIQGEFSEITELKSNLDELINTMNKLNSDIKSLIVKINNYDVIND